MTQISRRQKRVADLLKQEISQILSTETADPRIGFVTVSAVRMAPDLKSAKVYVHVMGDEKNKKSSMIGLERAVPFVRSQVASRVSLRYVPSLKFFYDEGIDHYQHIDHLLKEISHDLPSSG